MQNISKSNWLSPFEIKGLPEIKNILPYSIDDYIVIFKTGFTLFSQLKKGYIFITQIFEPNKNTPINIHNAVWSKETKEIILTDLNNVYFTNLKGKIRCFFYTESSIEYVLMNKTTLILITKVNTYYEIKTIDQKEAVWTKDKLFYNDIKFPVLLESKDSICFLTFDSYDKPFNEVALLEYNIKNKISTVKKKYTNKNYFEIYNHNKSFFNLTYNPYRDSLFITSKQKTSNTFHENLNIKEYIEELNLDDYSLINKHEIINDRLTSYSFIEQINSSCVNAEIGDIIIFYDYTKDNIIFLNAKNYNPIKTIEFNQNSDKKFITKEYRLQDENLNYHLGDFRKQIINLKSITINNNRSQILLNLTIENYDCDTYCGAFNCLKLWEIKNLNFYTV
jgi:hypothetical protein